MSRTGRAQPTRQNQPEFSERITAGGQRFRRTTNGTNEFQFNTGHAYREHSSGPASHPNRAGTEDEVETAIMNDIQQLISNGDTLPELRGPGSDPLSREVTLNDVTIKYKVGTTVDGVIKISDYWALP